MKTRNGFVSNSSSTSFTVIVPKVAADKVMAKLSPYEKICVNYLRRDKTFMGNDISVFQGVSGSNCNTFEYFELPDDYKKGSDDNEECGPWDAWTNFRDDVIKEAGDGNYIRTSAVV